MQSRGPSSCFLFCLSLRFNAFTLTCFGWKHPLNECNVISLVKSTEGNVSDETWAVMLRLQSAFLISQKRQKTGNSRTQHGGRWQCYRGLGLAFYSLNSSFSLKLNADWMMFERLEFSGFFTQQHAGKGAKTCVSTWVSRFHLWREIRLTAAESFDGEWMLVVPFSAADKSQVGVFFVHCFQTQPGLNIAAATGCWSPRGPDAGA